MRKVCVLAAAALVPNVALGDAAKYETPPPAVAKLISAQQIPSTSLGPDRVTLLLATPRVFPSIAEVAEAELRLAGYRVNPKNRAQSRRGFIEKMELLDTRTAGAKPRAITGITPAGARIGDASWSPDGKLLAFTVTDADSIRLWIADVASAKARQLATSALSGVAGSPCAWLADSNRLACRAAPRNAKAPAQAPTVPTGPIVQENEGKKKPARTNPDLLQNPSDELLFEHYLSAQLEIVDVAANKSTPIGKPGLYVDSTPSPDGKYLLVEALHRPFAYVFEADRFPTRTDVWTLDGKLVKTLADRPLADEIPVDNDAVRKGMRRAHWRSDAPSTLCWVEAQDGGDPKKQVPVRDVVDCVGAPFSAKPTRIAKLPLRYGGVSYSSGKLALVSESWWKERKTRTYVIAPDDAAAKQRVLWDRSYEDRYSDPGTPVMRREPNGQWLLHLTSKGQLLLRGAGASDKGDRPFFDRLDLATGASERLWRSDGETYASIREVLDVEGTQVVLSRESVAAPPQLFAQTLADKKERQLTAFQHPVPELANVSKQLIRWKRKDGVELSAMLYLPSGFTPKKSPALPVLVWAYPQEYKSASAASQVKDSPYRFAYPSWGGAMFALALGYAVVDNPTFVIVGEGKIEPNDTYVEQLTSDAESMIDHVAGLGVGDRDRFAIGGHSYGAFTTANLLAHTQLFRAGIARSGAYNRTLTPFGFQSEERTYWEAAAAYDRMSPFRFADKIDEPLLLIHGMDDNNPGTYPIQSERLFAAMQGNGGRVRYVQLPAESHGYRARESALHVLWEQVRWLDTHVKNAKKRPR